MNPDDCTMAPMALAARPADCDWILTTGGRKVWPTWPADPGEIHVDDIAHALSLLNRWTGHTYRPWSVAQHALIVAEIVQAMAPDLALAALHHDSAEAYLGDMATPVKRQLNVRREPGAAGDDVTFEPVGFVDDALRRAVFVILGIPEPSREGWVIIGQADRRVLLWEAAHLMPPMPQDAAIRAWGLPPMLLAERRPYPDYQPAETWTEVRQRFLSMHLGLLGPA